MKIDFRVAAAVTFDFSDKIWYIESNTAVSRKGETAWQIWKMYKI